MNEDLDLLIRKQAYCSISFLAYPLYRFISAFSYLIDETEFAVEEDHISIRCMDPSRICLMEITIKSKNYKFFSRGKIGLNVENLAKILKCNKEDKSAATLIFGKAKLYIEFKSETFNSMVERTLDALEIEYEDIPLDTIGKIEYPCKFSISKDKFENLLRNLALYSEVIEINVTDKKVSFNENGKLGNSEVFWKSQDIENLNLDFSVFKNELEQDDLSKENEEIAREILKEKRFESTYSINFLKVIGEMAKLLDKNDVIDFSIKNDHPIRVEIQFKNLDKTKIIYYLAPRVKDIEFLEEDPDEEEIDEF